MVTQSARKSKSDGRNISMQVAGMTSHDVVFKLKILGTKKIGRGGTLDPDVVGVLPQLARTRWWNLCKMKAKVW